MATTETATHFVVSRLNWHASWDRAFTRMPGELRVAAFADFGSAEVDRTNRETAARAHVNPFACGIAWGERSHLPEPVFRDFIADAGIEPPTLVPFPTTDEEGRPLDRKTRRMKEREELPAGTFRNWAGWWQATVPSLSAEQVSRVWEGLDRVRFFRVEERPVRAVAFAVIEIMWTYNDEWYAPTSEGGGPHTAYRTRERAEAECERLNGEARERWVRQLSLPSAGVRPAHAEGFEAFPFDMQNRPFPGDDPLGPRREPPARPWDNDPSYERGKFGVDEVPFYEVVEFELPEGSR